MDFLLKEKKSENHDVIIEFKEMDDKQINQDDYSIVGNNIECIPYIDDNVSVFTLEENDKKKQRNETIIDDQFLNLSVSDLKQLVLSKKKADPRKDGKLNINTTHNMLTYDL